jgi:hypothetical protein
MPIYCDIKIKRARTVVSQNLVYLLVLLDSHGYIKAWMHSKMPVLFWCSGELGAPPLPSITVLM